MVAVTINASTPQAEATRIHRHIMGTSTRKRKRSENAGAGAGSSCSTGAGAGHTSNEPIRFMFVTPEKISKSKRFMQRLEKIASAGCVRACVCVCV